MIFATSAFTPKINPKSPSYFSSPKNVPEFVHVYHAIHHKFTTIYHHVAPLFPKHPSKTPIKQQKAPATTGANFSAKKSLNPP
jgi:hypothetical protein